MATKLIKPVRREMLSSGFERGRNRNRAINVTLCPGDELEFHVKGTRQRYTVFLGHCFRLAQGLAIEANYKEACAQYAIKRKAGIRCRKPKRPMMAFSKIYFDATKTS